MVYHKLKTIIKCNKNMFRIKNITKVQVLIIKNITIMQVLMIKKIQKCHT